MELNRSDLLRLLSLLEAELQAREVVIAVLKSEHVKHLLYPSIKRPPISSLLSHAPPLLPPPSSLNDVRDNDARTSTATTYNSSTIIPSKSNRAGLSLMKQNAISICASSTSTSITTTTTTAVNLTNALELQSNELNLIESKTIDDRIMFTSDPYMALYRDAFYAIDSTFDEMSTKFVHNMQLKALDNLLNNHNRVRQYLKANIIKCNEKCTQLYDELQTEKEKNMKFERDATLKQIDELKTDKQKLTEELDTLRKQMNSEREREKQMIICLLSERKQLIVRLIEEKQKNTELQQLYNQEKTRIAEMVEGFEEESKRSLQMELDLERLTGEYEINKEILQQKLAVSESSKAALMAEVERLRTELEIKSKLTANLPDLGEGVRSSLVTVNPTLSGHRTNAIVPLVAAVTPPKLSVARPVSPSRSLNNATVTPVQTGCTTTVIINSSSSSQSISKTIKSAPAKQINPSIATFATVQPKSLSMDNTTTTPTTGEYSLPKPNAASAKAALCTSVTTSGAAYQNYANYSIESPIPPLPTSTPPILPPVSTRNATLHSTPPAATSSMITVSKTTLPSVETVTAQAKKVAIVAGATVTTIPHANRGAPPPIPPNKPVLPPQVLKERSKELANSAAKVKVVPGVASKIITTVTQQPVIVGGSTVSDVKTGEHLNQKHNNYDMCNKEKWTVDEEMMMMMTNELAANGNQSNEKMNDEVVDENDGININEASIERDDLCQEVADFHQILMSMVSDDYK